MSNYAATPPISINERTNVRLPLALIFAGVAAVAGATLAYAMQRNTVEAHTIALSSHENRIERLEQSQADLAVIRNDVRWIREQLARRP